MPLSSGGAPILVGLLHDFPQADGGTPVGPGYMAAFETAAARAGVDLVARAPISPIAEDASAVVTRLQTPGPEALVYLGLGVASRTLALAVHDADWKVPVAANSALMF